MTIQQVTSGSSKGIMNFLLQDDGSGEGTVLDGADFSTTLHQLLGEFEQDDGALAGNAGEPQDTTQALAELEVRQTLVATPAPEEVAAPALSADLETLTTDFALPAHGAELPHGVEWQDDAESGELTPFWHSAAFSDAASAEARHAVVPLDVTQIRDPAAAHAQIAPETVAYDTPAANDPAFSAAAAPAFNKGIEHVVALARQSDKLSAELVQETAPEFATAATLPPQEGRNRPASGKFLPLTFRQASLNQAVAGAHGKGAAGPAGTIGLPAGADSVALPSSETSFFGEVLSAETRMQQTAGQQAPALTQAIQGPRNDAGLPYMPKALATDAPAAATPQMSSPYVVGTDAWLQDLGTRVDWLKDKDMTKAELQLHPAELGTLEIHISTVDDATTVSFVTHNAAAREAIEDSLPRLREMFESQGMQLGESHVSQQSAENQRGSQDRDSQQAPQQQTGDTDDAASQRHSAYLADPNRIDHYV